MTALTITYDEPEPGEEFVILIRYPLRPSKPAPPINAGSRYDFRQRGRSHRSRAREVCATMKAGPRSLLRSCCRCWRPAGPLQRIAESTAEILAYSPALGLSAGADPATRRGIHAARPALSAMRTVLRRLAVIAR